MPNMGTLKVRFVTPEEADEDEREYTVPIPDWLTRDFHPSKPVTNKQTLDFEAYGREPYPGYAEEYARWEQAWRDVDDAQDEADGNHIPEMVLGHPSPEYDPLSGDPINYDEIKIAVNNETGDADMYIDEADLSDEELHDTDAK